MAGIFHQWLCRLCINTDQFVTNILTSLGDVSQLKKHSQKRNSLIVIGLFLTLNIQEGWRVCVA